MVDLVVFGGAAAARNGLTALPVNTGETFYKINSTNYLVMPEKRIVMAAMVVSAAIANVAQTTFQDAEKNNLTDLGTGFGRQQTAAFTQDLPMRCSIEMPAGSQLYAELNNGNNSQVDVLLLFLGKTGSESLIFGSQGNIQLPLGYQWFRFTGATTLTAATLTGVSLTPVSFTPADGAMYHIAGATGWGATAIAGRLNHKEGGTQGIRPGFLMGDDATPSVMTCTFQDFGSFKGSNYPIVETLAVAADTAQEFLFAIKRLK